MMEWKSEGKTNIRIDNRNIELEYYLLCQREEDWEQPVYGIAVEKRENGIKEHEMACGISRSKSIVKHMIDKLCCCTVTPISLLEIVDDIITEKALCEN